MTDDGARDDGGMEDGGMEDRTGFFRIGYPHLPKSGATFTATELLTMLNIQMHYFGFSDLTFHLLPPALQAKFESHGRAPTQKALAERMSQPAPPIAAE